MIEISDQDEEINQNEVNVEIYKILIFVLRTVCEIDEFDKVVVLDYDIN